MSNHTKNRPLHQPRPPEPPNRKLTGPSKGHPTAPAIRPQNPKR